jgi:hypothetical protein
MCLELLQTMTKSSFKDLLRRTSEATLICNYWPLSWGESKEVEEEPYRRNVTAPNAVLIKLGMAMQSRDVTKKGRPALDDYGAALTEVISGY